jgi:signal peptidase
MLSVGANANGAPILTYVYSNSMEPLIKVNDAFFVWPTNKLEVGDIVMFRPAVLKAPYITHRIIGIGENGFITKGDNSPFKDQDSGEPEISVDRIVGKVVTMNGQPLIIPRLGKLSAGIQSGLGNYTKYLSGGFFLLGFISLMSGNRNATYKRKSRSRLRLRHLYKGVVITCTILVMLSIYLGSRVTQIRYLVSEYPGNQGDQIAVNQPGKLTMEIRNNGFIPVLPVPTGIAPLSVIKTPDYIWSRSANTIVLDVLPQRQTGFYQGYVQVYNYPILLPRRWIVFLHGVNPILAIIAIGITFGILIKALFQLLSLRNGFEGWIPLRAIKDKLTKRRFKRAKAKYLGRRRVR